MDSIFGDGEWAMRDAYANLLELVDSVAQVDEAADREKLRTEAQETVLMLIAAVIVADGKYEAGEQAFIRTLVNYGDKPGGEMGYLNEYAALWMTASKEVPNFLQAAVRCGVARSMLCEIQRIGNYTCISDGKFQERERKIVAQYVAFLENSIEALEVDQIRQEGNESP